MPKKIRKCAEIYKEMEILKEELKESKKTERENNRVWEKHAKIVLGGMVVKCFEGSDWKKVDIRKFDEYISKWHGKIKEQCTVREEQDAETANNAIREFERWTREQKKQAQEAKNELAGTDE